MSVLRYFKKITIFLIDILYPHLCLSCKKTNATSGICVDCWNKLSFITNPCCSICSEPFEFDTRNDMVCGACLIKKPDFDKAICLVDYNDISKKLIHKMKFQDNYLIAKFFAPLLRNKIIYYQNEVDYIIPVPMHKYKLLKRKYNHASLLVKYIAHNLKIKVHNNILIKSKITISQASLTRKARLQNVKYSFKVNPDFFKNIIGKTIMVVDDVYTTGATLNECSRILKKHGAAKIIIVSICKNILH